MSLKNAKKKKKKKKKKFYNMKGQLINEVVHIWFFNA